MDQRLKENINSGKFIFALAFLFCVFGIGLTFVSDLFIIPFVAFYAALLWFGSNKKIVLAIVSLLVFGCAFLNGIGALFSVSAGLLCGLSLWGLYRARCSKADTVLILTAFFTFFLLLGLFFAICNITKEFSLSSAMTYYDNFIEEQKTVFVNMLSELHIADENGTLIYPFTEEASELMFLSVARLSFSFFVIAAFSLCGFTCKVFSRIIAYGERDESYIHSWRLKLPNLVAYFYIVLFVVSFFAVDENLFSVTVQNLFSVLVVVFAYFGLRHLGVMLSKAKKRGAFILVIIVLFFLLSVSALQFLSFLGVYASIVANRAEKK